MSIKKIHFITSFNEMAQEVHDIALEKGWWEGGRDDAHCIALMHSELSEALEYMRDENIERCDDKIPEFLGAEAELADCIIRIMDFAVKRRYKVAEALVAKIEFNKTRKKKHGKRF